jgi:hypothetical protein
MRKRNLFKFYPISTRWTFTSWSKITIQTYCSNSIEIPNDDRNSYILYPKHISETKFNFVFEKEYEKLLDRKLLSISMDKSLKKTPLFDNQFIIDLKKIIHSQFNHVGDYYNGYDIHTINKKIDKIIEQRKEYYEAPNPGLLLGSQIICFLSSLKLIDHMVSPEFIYFIPLDSIVSVSIFGLCCGFGLSFGICSLLTIGLNSIKWDYYNLKHFRLQK